jgi:hypothetical protein
LKDFIEIITQLQNTPVPNLLVVAGLIFIILAVVGKIGAVIELSTKKQKWTAGVLGTLFLFFGIGLFVIPNPSPQSSDALGSTPQPTSQQIPLQSTSDLGSHTEETRSEALVIYDSIYKQQGWPDLWNKLTEDNLVSGSCPSTVNQVAKEDIITGDGDSINLITGVEIVITSDVKVNYPACINYGIDGDYATLSGGRTQEWTANSNIATDVTVKANSIFSLYFRCDHVAWR